MPKQRYKIAELPISTKARRFYIVDLEAIKPQEKTFRVDFVVYQIGKALKQRLECQHCRTPFRKKSSSCPHARVARRYLRKEREAIGLVSINAELTKLYGRDQT